MKRMRNRITIRLWFLQLCIGLCLVSRIANCDDDSSPEESKSQEEICKEDDDDPREILPMQENDDDPREILPLQENSSPEEIKSQEEICQEADDNSCEILPVQEMSESPACVRYGTKKEPIRFKKYCNLCSIDHEEESLHELTSVVKMSSCSDLPTTCTKNALDATSEKTLKPVCGRKGRKKKWYCGFCSLQKEQATFKASNQCNGAKPNCGGEPQGPDGTTNDEKYRYVKRYCVAGEEGTTCNNCAQKAPSFKVKMPEFLESYKSKP